MLEILSTDDGPLGAEYRARLFCRKMIKWATTPASPLKTPDKTLERPPAVPEAQSFGLRALPPPASPISFPKQKVLEN